MHIDDLLSLSLFHFYDDHQLNEFHHRFELLQGNIYIDKNGYTYYKDTYDNRIKIDNTGLRIKDTKNNEIKSEGTKLVINGNLEISQ
jgi:virulence-associated protein VapD